MLNVRRRPAHYTNGYPHPRDKGQRVGRLWAVGEGLCEVKKEFNIGGSTVVIAPYSTPRSSGR